MRSLTAIRDEPQRIPVRIPPEIRDELPASR